MFHYVIKCASPVMFPTYIALEDTSFSSLYFPITEGWRTVMQHFPLSATTHHCIGHCHEQLRLIIEYCTESGNSFPQIFVWCFFEFAVIGWYPSIIIESWKFSHNYCMNHEQVNVLHTLKHVQLLRVWCVSSSSVIKCFPAYRNMSNFGFVRDAV